MEAPAHACYIISGLSGAGKSTTGRALAEEIPGLVFVEGDAYYREDKPFVALSDGARVKNWDSEDAIDWPRLRRDVASLLARSDVVLVTFLPRLDLLGVPITRHVRLAYSAETADREIDIQLCALSRRATKGHRTPEAQERDLRCVREVVYPAYERARRLYPGDATVLTHAGVERRPPGEVLAEVRRALGL